MKRGEGETRGEGIAEDGRGVPGRSQGKAFPCGRFGLVSMSAVGTGGQAVLSAGLDVR